MSFRIVCDLDGTIVNTKERMDEIESKYGIDNWSQNAIDDFIDPAKIAQDATIEKGVATITNLVRKYNAYIFFLTGRSEAARDCTLDWLSQNLWKVASNDLFMRSNSDPNKKPKDVKEENFLSLRPKSNEIWLFFDDDPDCVKLYSKYGLSFKAPECWDFMEIEKGDIDDRQD